MNMNEFIAVCLYAGRLAKTGEYTGVNQLVEIASSEFDIPTTIKELDSLARKIKIAEMPTKSYLSFSTSNKEVRYVPCKDIEDLMSRMVAYIRDKLHPEFNEGRDTISDDSALRVNLKGISDRNL
jgi:hypothetical protein